MVLPRIAWAVMLPGNAFRLLLHSFAYNLVNVFRLQLPSSMRSAQIETLRISTAASHSISGSLRAGKVKRSNNGSII